MLKLSLEPLDNQANPAFKDAASCARWLSQFQLTDVTLAHATLLTQLYQLNRMPLPSDIRWEILEKLSDTIFLVQADYSKKLLGKKLPLLEKEFTTLISSVMLWQQMSIGYQRCLQAQLDGEKQLNVVEVCERCLRYNQLQIFEYLQACYEVDAVLWQQLHALYYFTEELGIQAQEIRDDHSLQGINKKPIKRNISCQTTYIQTLLMNRACPHELSRKKFQLLEHWLMQWCHDMTLYFNVATGHGDAPPLAVDLAGTQGLQAVQKGAQNSQQRYLAMVSISKLIRAKTILLQQGQSPQQVGLGEVPSDVNCVEFLNYLHQCWCENINNVETPTQSDIAHETQACYGLEEIYTYLANKPFRLKSKGIDMDVISRKRIAMFGSTQLISDTPTTNFGQPLEAYEIEEESPLGVKLLRKSLAGVRLTRNQIIALRSSTSGIFKVGVIKSAQVTYTGQLAISVRHLPGLAQAVTLDSKSPRTPGTKPPAAAILFPALTEVGIPASLLIPRDWFQPGLELEITNQDNNKFIVRLGLSAEKGLDFERVNFT